MTVDLTMADLAGALAEAAPAHELDLVGAVPLSPAPHADAWRSWLDAGYHGDLTYLERTREERADPRLRNPEATTMLVVAQRYDDGFGEDQPAAAWLSGVARYARGADYHDTLLSAFRGLLADLRERWPSLRAYPAVDTGPYLERDWAAAAGLGFIGRNTCLIHESLGSALFLAVAPTNLVLADQPARPAPLFATASRGRLPRPTADRCGSCTRCLEACPTEALRDARLLDASRCLSTWTIEWRGRAPADQRQRQGGHLFGCDRCQEVCPWNQRAARQAPGRPSPAPTYSPLPDHDELDLADLLTMTADTFRQRFRRTPLWRQHPEGLRRNALVVTANTGRVDLLPTVRMLAAEDPDPEVRSVAGWALEQLEVRS